MPTRRGGVDHLEAALQVGTMKTSTLSSVAMIACFFMLHSSAFQIIGNKGPLTARRPCRLLPSSCLYSTPVQDITADTDTDNDAAIDTEVKFSATDFILSEISTHDVSHA